VTSCLSETSPPSSQTRLQAFSTLFIIIDFGKSVELNSTGFDFGEIDRQEKGVYCNENEKEDAKEEEQEHEDDDAINKNISQMLIVVV